MMGGTAKKKLKINKKTLACLKHDLILFSEMHMHYVETFNSISNKKL